MSVTITRIPVHPTRDEDGQIIHQCSVVPIGSGQIHQIQHSLIIPVIFVPGIMGSNLVDNKGGNIWNGDNFFGYSIPYKLLPWVMKGAAYRKEKLDPSRAKLRESKNLRKDKGWDEPGQAFYLESLEWLQANLNDYDSYNQKTGERFLMQDGDEQKILSSEGELKEEIFQKSLKTEDVQKSYNFDFPVYACGYNWLDDNKNAAEFLLKRINDVLNIEKQNGPTLGKVIIVTHSMGGLVTRYCSEIAGGKDKILGVVHGVMPATGAAAAYTRMKTGNIGGGITNKVLGATGADMSAVMSQAPGSLELLPFKEYGEGQFISRIKEKITKINNKEIAIKDLSTANLENAGQWLRIEEGQGTTTLLPKADPFAEIYTTDKWYGLFEEQLVNPDGLKPKYRTEKIQFNDLITYKVKIFQSLLKNKYNSNSYVFYGKSNKYKCYGYATWSKKTDNFARVTGYSRPGFLGGTSYNDFRNRPKDGENKVGGTEREITKNSINYNYYTLSDPNIEGDGTVPVISGAAPKGKPGVKCIHYLETDHQAAYNAKEAQLFTVWSIVQIMKQVKCQ